MEELRWILLVVGLVVVAAVYWFGDPERRSASRGRSRGRGETRREPGLSGDPTADPDAGLGDELDRLGQAISKERGELDGPAAEGARSVPDPDRVVVLYVKAPRGSSLVGPAIFEAADKVGLEYGELNIFHRMHEARERREAVYSLANITKPGDFDQTRMGSLVSPGLCLFMTLPNPLRALDAWDAMLATGRRLADLLNADLQDESHSTLIRQRIAQIREEMRDYDRRGELES